MNSPQANIERLDSYRELIQRMSQKANVSSRINYVLANFALDELKISIERAEEPSEVAFTMVADRFDLAAATAGDPLTEGRSRLLKAWIRPAAWSDVVNIGTLNDREAKKVAENIQLGQAADETAFIAQKALQRYDKNLQSLGANVKTQYFVSGLLNETTPLLLKARHTTAKAYAVPTTHFDDAMNPDISQHIDGIYFDNRPSRDQSKQAFQVGPAGSHSHIHPSIPVITPRDLGNIKASPLWPGDDRPFVTLRHLVDERIGEGIEPSTSSQLDKINSSITAKIQR